MLQITALMENQMSENKALTAQHGLSLYVVANGVPFLFDCGAGPAVMANARRMGLDLNAVQFTILSHSHYDHAAGFRDMAEAGYGGATLMTGPDFFHKKYARDGMRFTDLSAGFDEAFLSRHGIGHTVCSSTMEILPGVYLVADFARRCPFETIPERFVTDFPAHPVPDDFHDEICLVADSAEGLVLVVGCSHPGIVNMVESVRERFGKPVYAVLGGTHLVEADESRVHATVDRLVGAGVRMLAPDHCSGSAAESIIREDGRVECFRLSVGDSTAFPLATV